MGKSKNYLFNNISVCKQILTNKSNQPCYELASPINTDPGYVSARNLKRHFGVTARGIPECDVSQAVIDTSSII